MHGKPFAVIETDGHTGDAGTKTRIEAFLHCVAQDRVKSEQSSTPRDLPSLTKDLCDFADIDKQNETVLIPWMGPCSEIGAACLRSAGFNAEALPQCDRNALQIGRRYTSGKECVPISLTLGRLIDKLQREPGRRFAFLMPRTNGPCRLGLYHLLQKIVIEELGTQDRCRFVSPNETGYMDGLPKGFTTLIFSGIVAHDLLHEALLLVRPAEKVHGAADQIHARYTRELYRILATQQRLIHSPVRALTEVLTGRLFGISQLLRKAGKDFAAMPRAEVPGDCSPSKDRRAGDLPVVLLVGEIYVRHDSFANDDIVTRLEARGMRVRFAPLNGWFEYVDYCNSQVTPPTALDRTIDFLKKRIEHVGWRALAKHVAVAEPVAIGEMAQAASDYLAGDVGGEAVLTLGHALYEWRQGIIDAVVNVGPLECMPTRITESQFFHAAEREGLPSLTLTFNGDPLPNDALDNFAFEVHARYRQKRSGIAPSGCRSCAE
jgi:predicted nucleotide-binding protein (sugar kinase/HSP70/actin superfamily)